MTSPAARALLILTLMTALVACGGSSDETAAPDDTQAGSSPTELAGETLAPDEVCPLLSEEDATAVVTEQADPGSTFQTYTLTATPVEGAFPGCTFTIEGSDSDGQPGYGGTIGVEAGGVIGEGVYSDDEAIPDLGDEAYGFGGLVIVRVGGLVLQTTENTFGGDFAVAILAKMVDNLV